MCADSQCVAQAGRKTGMPSDAEDICDIAYAGTAPGSRRLSSSVTGLATSLLDSDPAVKQRATPCFRYDAWNNHSTLAHKKLGKPELRSVMLRHVR